MKSRTIRKNITAPKRINSNLLLAINEKDKLANLDLMINWKFNNTAFKIKFILSSV